MSGNLPYFDNKSSALRVKGDVVGKFEQAQLVLSSEGKGTVDQVLDKKALSLQKNINAVIDTMVDAKSILTSQEFDGEALSVIHEKMEFSNGAVKRDLAEIIEGIAKELSPEDRIKFFEHALPKNPSKIPLAE